LGHNSFYLWFSCEKAMDPWIVFDSRKTPRAEFDGWLETNKPPQVGRFGDEEGGKGPVGWISVLGLDHCPATGDITGLQESWESLLDSGRHVTFQIVKELALNHRVLTGKGLMHLDSGFKVDHACECVARAAVEGKISLTKVNPCDPKSDSKYVICSYNKDFMDKNRGDECQLSFKQDVYTYLGIVSWLAAPVFVWACVLGYCPLLTHLKLRHWLSPALPLECPVTFLCDYFTHQKPLYNTI
uniref:Uncharacterized protein n=1 Tax=Oncorhynchus mykiss TaxID=8022 RepID=A0A8C7P8A8_ONCMY